MRILSASLAVAALAVLPLAGSAAPVTAPQAKSASSRIVLVQGQEPGWWEREGRPDELRERYWRLPPPERARYNQVEMEIRQLQARIDQLHRQQYHILRWGE
jgi:hypothetical protein